MRDKSGFTLIELVLIVALLGIVAAVGVPSILRLLDTSKVNATKAELSELKKAIVGDALVSAGGVYASHGYENDTGHPPSRLQDLVAKPDSVPTFDIVTGIGWNGPYIDSAGVSYLYDAWGSEYVYSSAYRTITSTGSGTDVSINF
jgi:type II secretory pathway pseudopilin PulG